MVKKTASPPADDDDDDKEPDNSGLSIPQERDNSALFAIGDETGQGGRVWTNLRVKSPKLAAAMVKASGKADFTADDLPGMAMKVCYLIVQSVNLLDKNTGEIVTVPRVVMIDKDGKSCQFCSVGIFGSVKVLVELFGYGPWEPGIPVKLIRGKTSTGNQIFRLEIDASEPMPSIV